MSKLFPAVRDKLSHCLLSCRQAGSFNNKPVKKTILFILMLTFVACSTHEKRYDDIDLIAYQYVRYDSEDPEFVCELKLVCVYYAYIDNHYNGQLIVQRAFDNPGIWYYQINGKDQTIRHIIDNMILSSSSFEIENDLRPDRATIYDGPEIKIKINFKNHYKLIHFCDGIGASSDYEQLFNYLDSLYRNNSLDETESIDFVESRRKDFIKFVSKSDSLLRPFPPNIKREKIQ
jgi:hypothetical protein